MLLGQTNSKATNSLSYQNEIIMSLHKTKTEKKNYKTCITIRRDNVHYRRPGSVVCCCKTCDNLLNKSHTCEKWLLLIICQRVIKGLKVIDIVGWSVWAVVPQQQSSLIMINTYLLHDNVIMILMLLLGQLMQSLLQKTKKS